MTIQVIAQVATIFIGASILLRYLDAGSRALKPVTVRSRRRRG